MRVSDETLNLICGIIATSEGLSKGESETFGDALRACALDLRDARAKVERLRAALLPFADHYARIDFWLTDKVASYCLGGSIYWIRLAELREAAEAAKAARRKP